MSNLLPGVEYRRPVEFKIGETIARTWAVVSRNFLTFALLAALVQLPWLLAKLFLPRPKGGFALILFGMFMGVLHPIVSRLQQAFVIHAAYQDLLGRPVDAMASLKQGLKRVAAVILTSIIAGVAVGLGAGLPDGPWEVLLIVLGVIIASVLAVAMPACVMEHKSAMESFLRSRDLTQGHRGPILGVFVALGVVWFLADMAVGVVIPAETALQRAIVDFVISVLAGSLTSVYAAILYHDLRAVREGTGIEEIASVFD